MILEVKKVKECKNKAYANFMIRGRDKALITVSLKKNNMLVDYGSTLLHELLHFWMTMLRKEGVKASNKTEHRFIYAVEDMIFDEMKKHFNKAA